MAFLIVGLNLGGISNTIKAVIIALGAVMIIMHLLQFFAFSFSGGKKKGKV